MARGASPHRPSLIQAETEPLRGLRLGAVSVMLNVNPGAKVVVEAQHGGHWEGKVTFVWPSVEEYMEDHDHEPSLVVQEVIDPGPAVTLH